MTIQLKRFAHTPFGTFGSMMVGGRIIYTVEQHWRNNEVGVSCIPVGTYHVKRGFYYGGGYECFELPNVPGRTHIKIHAANLSSQLRGCIAPGLTLGSLNGEWAVLNSRAALNWMLERLPALFDLEVVYQAP